tara:strand:+ start:41 stop:472 length:432 start_codon:yes stop_codon:yes gene_type:complete
MGLIKSIRKSMKLKKLSNHYISNGGFGGGVVSMMQFDQEEFFDELYELMVFDHGNRVVVDHFKIDKEALEEKFQTLIVSGCGMSVRGHFVAISAFAFFQTLEYVFSSKPESRDELHLIAFNLVDWFGEGKSNRLVEVNYGVLT